MVFPPIIIAHRLQSQLYVYGSLSGEAPTNLNILTTGSTVSGFYLPIFLAGASKKTVDFIRADVVKVRGLCCCRGGVVVVMVVIMLVRVRATVAMRRTMRLFSNRFLRAV